MYGGKRYGPPARMLACTGFDLVDVDSHRGQSGDFRFRMGLPGLPVAPLVVTLFLEFFLVSFSTRGRLQIGGRQPGARRTANLFDRQTIGLVALRSIVLLTHPGTEQVARLR